MRHVLDLFDAYERIMASIDFSKLGDHAVEMDDTPIAAAPGGSARSARPGPGRQRHLAGRLRRPRAGCKSIGLFLAMLELVRQRRVVVKQDRINSEIVVELNEDPRSR